MDRKMCEQLVNTRGRFEGEHPYVPYFYSLGLNRGYKESVVMDDAIIAQSFAVDGKDRAMFPELVRKPMVYLTYRNDGAIAQIDEKTFGLLGVEASKHRQVVKNLEFF